MSKPNVRIEKDTFGPIEVPADKLWLNPDCGFWETPRWVTRHKLAALAQGAAIVRKELAG